MREVVVLERATPAVRDFLFDEAWKLVDRGFGDPPDFSLEAVAMLDGESVVCAALIEDCEGYLFVSLAATAEEARRSGAYRAVFGRICALAQEREKWFVFGVRHADNEVGAAVNAALGRREILDEESGHVEIYYYL